MLKPEPRTGSLSPLFLAQNLPGVVCPASGDKPDAIKICGMVTPLTAFVSLNGTLVSLLSVVCVVTLVLIRSVASLALVVVLVVPVVKVPAFVVVPVPL